MSDLIDWSKAPEDCLGAVHLKDEFTESEEDYGIFVTKTKGSMEEGYHYCGHKNIGPLMSSHTFTPKPDVKPVTVPTFTELPKHPIGTKVNLVEDTGFYSANRDTIFTATPEDEVEVIGYCNHPLSGNECVTLYFEPYGFSTINPEYIQPLTPPIEPIDGETYQLSLPNPPRLFLGFYRESRNSFFTELNGGNKVCGKNEPDNIQLLGVTK